MKTVDSITGICVCWNTKELVDRAYSSIRAFHPDMRVVFIDGSKPPMECFKHLDYLAGKDIKTQVIHVGYNIGHGRGMHLGIQKVQTPFVLFFDSDIEMVKSPLEGMASLLEDRTFGVGYSEFVGHDGFDYGVYERHKKQTPVRYLHPYFQLVQVKEYKKYRPYIHHGAPCIATMLDIHNKGLSDIVLKDFPGLGHTGGCGISWKPCAGEYILHDVSKFGGTGRMRVENGLPHIEGAWEKIKW